MIIRIHSTHNHPRKLPSNSRNIKLKDVPTDMLEAALQDFLKGYMPSEIRPTLRRIFPQRYHNVSFKLNPIHQKI